MSRHIHRLHPRGFTLLEAVVAMAILATSLMAIFDLNAGAIANHVYAKKLTVATQLARSKMTDLEQMLYDEGFAADDREESGDFSDEGWPTFRWRARILVPKTQNVSPDTIMAALMGMPAGDEGGGGLSALFSGAGSTAGAAGAALPPGATPGPMGAGAGLLQPALQQLTDQLNKGVREIRLTVSWQDGTQTESVDVVTHVVTLGTGGDRNGLVLPQGTSALPGMPGAGPGQGAVQSPFGTPSMVPPPGRGR
jgi:general secretion pathway protein I